MISAGDEGWSFIGLTPAPEIASYAFTALYRQLKAARATYMSDKLKRVATARRKTARADAFAEGWATAVHNAIAKLYPPQVTDALVRNWMERRYPRAVALSPRGATAPRIENDRGAGWMAGRNVELHQGVGAAARPLRLETGA